MQRQTNQPPFDPSSNPQEYVSRPQQLLKEAQLVERVQSEYQLIEIYHHPRFGNLLYTDRDFEIGETDESYNTAMASPLLTLEQLDRVVILGGGDGGVLKSVLDLASRRDRQSIYVELLEIDEKVIELSKRHLRGLCGDGFDDPRANIVIGDAFARVEGHSQLDAVVYDISLDPLRDDQTRTEWIEELVPKIHRSLRDGGMLSMICCRDPLAGGQVDDDRMELLADIRRIVPQYFSDVREQMVFVPSYGENLIFLSARR